MQVLINLLQFSELETRLETRTTELISCKEEIASLKVSVFPEKCLFKATDSDSNSVFQIKILKRPTRSIHIILMQQFESTKFLYLFIFWYRTANRKRTRN